MAHARSTALTRPPPLSPRELDDALDHGSLALVYQPVLDLRTGLVAGLEALARLRLDGREVAPDAFIPLAERTAQTRADPTFSLAVNVSVATLKDPLLPQDVAARCAEHGVAPSALTLEITETLLSGPGCALGQGYLPRSEQP